MADPDEAENPIEDLEDEVREKGWTPDELADTAFVGPEDEGTTEVVFHDEWEEHPEEAPMDAHLHENDEVTERLSGGDPVLSILYRGAYIKIWNEEFHVWGAEIDVPPDVARWLVGSGGVEHELKSRFAPRIGDHKVGYVDEVKRDHEATRGEDGADVPPTTLVVKTATNFQPMVEVQALVDDLWEHAEESEEAAANAEAAFEAAKENLGE